MPFPGLQVVQFQIIGISRQQIDVTVTDVGTIAEVHTRVDLVSPRTVHAPRVVELQLMSVAEIITDIGARVDLEIRRVFLVRESGIGVLYCAGIVFVTRLQMAHVILAAQTHLDRQAVEETVAVRDIERVVLRQSLEISVVREQFLDMCALFVVVMRVSRAVVPTAGVVVAGFQTALLRRFPFVVRLHLDTLIFAEAGLVLVRCVIQVGRQVPVRLHVIGRHVKTEVVVSAADVQFMIVQLEGVVECRVSSRVRANAVLVAGVVTQDSPIRLRQQVRTMVGVGHLEGIGFAHHAETGHAECMSFRQTEIEACASKESSTTVGLCSFLQQVCLDERTIQLLSSCAG